MIKVNLPIWYPTRCPSGELSSSETLYARAIAATLLGYVTMIFVEVSAQAMNLGI